MDEDNKTAPTSKPTTKSIRRPKLPRRYRFTLALLVIVVAAVASAFYFYSKYQDSQEKLKNPDILAKAERQVLLEKVSKHVLLPEGEDPTIATVSDVSKLSNQAFFAKAANGDKVLIYSKARKAILYRPITDKVIEIAPLNISN